TSTTTASSTTTTAESSAAGGSTSSGTSSSASTGSGGGATTTCPLPAYPDASCTGAPAGTPLEAINGDLTLHTPSELLDAQDIHGCGSVNASGVKITRSKISCAGYYTIYNHTATGLVIEDSEIDCQNTSGTAIGDTNFTVRRSNISGCENGFDIDGND